MCGFFVNARFDLVVGVSALHTLRRHFHYLSFYLKIRSCSLSRSKTTVFMAVDLLSASHTALGTPDYYDSRTPL